MDTREVHRANWLAIVILVLSALITIQGVLLWGSIVFPGIGHAILDPFETEVIQVGLLFLPLPLGLLDIIVGGIALLKGGPTKTKVAIVGVLVGALGALTGLFWLAVFSNVFGQIY